MSRSPDGLGLEAKRRAIGTRASGGEPLERADRGSAKEIGIKATNYLFIRYTMIDGEKQLIERAIRGEASAFGLLYDTHQPRIYRFIYLKVSHREEAEDLTHQVFLESWRNITGYRHQGFPFSAWLYRIARNAIIDYYRTKKTHIALEVIQDDEQAEVKLETSLFEAVEQTISIEQVKAAIQKLKPLDQDIIILRFVEDLSPQEVGLLVEKTPEAVRVLQHRAIKNLKNILNTKRQYGR